MTELIWVGNYLIPRGIVFSVIAAILFVLMLLIAAAIRALGDKP